MIVIKKLTRSNIDALRLMRDAGYLPKTINDLPILIYGSMASFPGTALEALRLVEKARDNATVELGATGHPVQSLHAVIRKLQTLASGDAPDDVA